MPLWCVTYFCALYTFLRKHQFCGSHATWGFFILASQHKKGPAFSIAGSGLRSPLWDRASGTAPVFQQGKPNRGWELGRWIQPHSAAPNILTPPTLKPSMSPTPYPLEKPYRPCQLSQGQQNSILPTLLRRLKLALIWIISNDPIGLSIVQRHNDELVPATKAYKLINEKIGLVISVKQCKDVNRSPMVSGPYCRKCCKTFSPKRQDLGMFLNYLKNTLLKLPSSSEEGNVWKGHVVITDVSVLQSGFYSS